MSVTNGHDLGGSSWENQYQYQALRWVWVDWNSIHNTQYLDLSTFYLHKISFSQTILILNVLGILMSEVVKSYLHENLPRSFIKLSFHLLQYFAAFLVDKRKDLGWTCEESLDNEFFLITISLDLTYYVGYFPPRPWLSIPEEGPSDPALTRELSSSRSTSNWEAYFESKPGWRGERQSRSDEKWISSHTYKKTRDWR